MKKQKLKGRPTKNPSDKKSVKITVKLSEQEYRGLMEKVNQANIKTTSEFVREAIFHGQIKERLSVEDMALIRKLSGMSNNINQLAKEAHIYDLRYMVDVCIDTCYGIDELLNRLKG